MTWTLFFQLLAIALAGGGAVGFIRFLYTSQGKELATHGVRITALEAGVTVDSGVIDRVAHLEAVVPENVRERLISVEKEKLSVADHTKICDLTLKNIETQICSIKQSIERHEQRLLKGDELFTNLERLAGKMEAHIDKLDK